jgi:superfamily I DNA/RNA helicase
MEGEARIIQLTEEQRDVLGVLQHQRRAVIDGCAGSGKTMLAIEKAIRLATEGFDVLLTCYNRNLSTWMASVIARQPSDIAARIRVSHYHDLAVKLCEEAGMPSVVRPADPAYWNDALPEDLLRAIPHLDTRFDAIVADEGQDFADAWWLTLLELLRNPDDGVFYIFRDERQDIYRRQADLPFTTLPFALQGNMRNTATIHTAVTAYYDGDPKPRSRGPEGRDVEVIVPGDKPLRALLRDVIHRLVAVEGLRPDQVVILTPHAQAHSAIADGTDAGDGLRLTWSIEPGPKQVCVSSIHGFKGLESDVVVLAETDRLAESDVGQRLSYVALSRAKHHLIVIGHLPPPAG